MRHYETDVSAAPSIWPMLSRMRETLGISPLQMADLMHLTPREYQLQAVRRRSPPARSLMELCRELHISFDHLMNDGFCYRAMARQFGGEKSAIPDKYVIEGKSKRRILANLLDFVEANSNYQRRLSLMRHLQINETALADANGTINLRCTMDAVDWLANHFGDERLLRRLGREMILAPQNLPVFKTLENCRSVYELFESLMFESGLLYSHFEKNFLWKIHKIIPGKKVVVRGFVNPEICEQFGSDPVKFRAGSIVRAGMASAMPEILGWQAVPVSIRDLFENSPKFYEVEFDISQVVRTDPRCSVAVVN